MCAFSFVWWNQGQDENQEQNQRVSETDPDPDPDPDPATAVGAVAEKKGTECFECPRRIPHFLRALAVGIATSPFLVGTLDTGVAPLAGLDALAPSGGVGTTVGELATR